MYKFTLCELYRKLGNLQLVSTACILLLLRLNSFKDGDYEAFRYFSSTLHSVIATLDLGGYQADLRSGSTIMQLVNATKTPNSHRPGQMVR